MAHHTLVTERQERILTVRINRPEVLNALNQLVFAELGQVLTAGKTDDTVGGIIITGAGDKAFVAGADIAEMKGFQPGDALNLSKTGQKLFAEIAHYPKPILAAINGFALGGGLELALACHLRLAAENARMGLPEVKLGLLPGYGGTQRLPELIGRTKAVELMLTGEMVTAQEALTLGLLSYIVPQAELLPLALELMRKILKNSALSIRHIIEAVNAGYTQGVNGYEVEAINFSRSSTSVDGVEGTTAFLEKRPPHFTGR